MTKKGLEVPIAGWLRNELKDWGKELLFSSSSGMQDEWFDRQAMRRVWNEHQAKEQNHKDLLWAILMYYRWKNKYSQYLS